MAAFSDDFDRVDSDSLGANWTEQVGDADIFSNTLRFSTGAFGDVLAVYSGTACADIQQYIKITIADTVWPQVVFRYTNAASEFYLFEIDVSLDTITWYHVASAGGTKTQIGSALSITIAANDILGFTVDGTGASTDIRVWINPTGLPTAADNWNGDTTPDGSWLTTDPGANAVDQGTFLALACQQAVADTVRVDAFFGGDLPGGAGAAYNSSVSLALLGVQ